MAYFGADVNKTNNKKQLYNQTRFAPCEKKTAGENKQYSENDKILKTRKIAILQRL